MSHKWGPAALAAVCAAAAAPAEAEDSARPPGSLDEELVSSVQGLMAAYRLDGWLLYDDGDNPAARELTAPAAPPDGRWFYFIPTADEPALIARPGDMEHFSGLPGDRRPYTSHRDLEAALDEALEGAERVAMEIDPEGGRPELDRADAGTVDLVRRRGVDLRSSADLLLQTAARWLAPGRVAHYAAVHHIIAARDDALRYVAARVASGEPVTERDVADRVRAVLEARGVTGPAPRVAIGAHAADPSYVPGGERAAPLRRGDILVLEIAGRLRGAERAVYADMAWTVYVGEEVPEAYRELFAAAAAARDAAIERIRERVEGGRGVRGDEVDRRAREVARAAGYGDAWRHPTGHSLGTQRPGVGVHLDDGDRADRRALASGTGVAVGPGLYLRGEAGAITRVGVYVDGRRVEVTGPLQQRVTPLLR